MVSIICGKCGEETEDKELKLIVDSDMTLGLQFTCKKCKYLHCFSIMAKEISKMTKTEMETFFSDPDGE